MRGVGEEVEGFDDGKLVRGVRGREESGEVAGLCGGVTREVDDGGWLNLGEAVDEGWVAASTGRV